MSTVSDTSTNQGAQVGANAIAVVWAGSAALALLGHTSLFRGSKLVVFLAFVVLALLLTIAARTAVGKLSNGLPQRHLLGWSLLCLAAGVLLAVAIPVDPPVISPILGVAVSLATGVAITLTLLPVGQ